MLISCVTAPRNFLVNFRERGLWCVYIYTYTYIACRQRENISREVVVKRCFEA